MLCSHCPINDSSGCLHIIVYLAVMLQASWHTAKVTKSQKFHISSHDVLQKSHTSEEGGAHHRISFLHLLMSFENQKNQNFEKMKKKKCWRYYYFTYVYQKLQSGTVPEIQSDTFFFCQLRPFFVLYPPPPLPLTTQKTKILKKRKKHLEMSAFVCMLTKIWSVTDIIVCHFRPLFLLPHC